MSWLACSAWCRSPLSHKAPVCTEILRLTAPLVLKENTQKAGRWSVDLWGMSVNRSKNNQPDLTDQNNLHGGVVLLTSSLKGCREPRISIFFIKRLKHIWNNQCVPHWRSLCFFIEIHFAYIHVLFIPKVEVMAGRIWDSLSLLSDNKIRQDALSNVSAWTLALLRLTYLNSVAL